jgi:DNA-directed RNA polymerase specialized sigma24 family protein
MVKLRVFAGMTVDEAAALQGISTRTAKRNWAYARAWLGRELATKASQPG